MNRRDFLASAGTMAAALAVAPGCATSTKRASTPTTVAPASTTVAPRPAAADANPGRIDVHHHVLPDFYVSTLATMGVTTAGGIPFPTWTPDTSLATMDETGVATAMLSLSSPGVHLDSDAAAVELATRVNDHTADLVRDHPGRFGFFACLPMPALDASIIETTRALDELDADGVVLLASSRDRFLGDPEFDPLLAELDQRNAVVFIHPNGHSSSFGLGLESPAFVTEFVVDTTRAVTNMLWTGALDRYPNIRWIIAHAGGTIPYLAWRLSLLDLLPGFLDRSPEGATHYLKRLYFDTALSASTEAMSGALALVGPDQILFGSDVPFAPEVVAVREVEDLGELDILDADAHAAIDRENALELFPRLA